MSKSSGSIKTLFVVSIIVLTAVLLTVQTFMNVSQFKSGMENQVKETLTARAGDISGELNRRLMEVAQKTSGLALGVNSMKVYDPDVMFGMADGYILSDPLVIGSGFWFAPRAFSPEMEYYGPYRFRTDNGAIDLTMDYSNAEYNYPSFGWYKAAMANPKQVAWEGPYLDDVSGTTMLTSAAGLTKNGQSIGAVTVDIGITELENYIRSITIGANGYAFLVSADGYYLATKDNNKNMKQKISEESNADLAAFGRKIMAAKELTLEETDVLGADSYVMISPLAIDNMRLVIVAPHDDYSGPIDHAIYLSIIMAVAVMVILCAAMIAIFNRRIGGPIEYLVAEADKIAQGNLKSEINVQSDDEMGMLGGALQNMSANLKKVITEVRSMSEQVAAASEELTASSEQSSQAANLVATSIVTIAEGAAAQANEAQNIKCTAEDVTAKAKDIAERTQAIAATASGTGEKIVTGRTAIGEAVEQMHLITTSTESIQTSIQKLKESGQKIGEIVGMITSITEQTNLLALNAAIEAARAGEAGRGFAVVADEVRKLAEESNNSSQQIVELVKSNNVDMEQAINAGTEGAASVKKGIDTVQAADEVFQSIVGTITALVKDINTIAAEIQEMTADNERMLEASANINDTCGKSSDEAQSVSAATEQQTASTHEIADASRSLAKLAGDLQAEINRFRL